MIYGVQGQSPGARDDVPC